MQRARPEPFTAEQLQGAQQLRQRLAHILPPTLNTDFFLARWYRAYSGDLDEIERKLGELITHRHTLGYDAEEDLVKWADEHEFTRKTFERFAISRLNVDVFSDDVAVFLQKMKGVDLKEIMRTIPLGHVLHSYFLLQECFHRAMHAHEQRTNRQAATVIIIDLEGLAITDFINPLSTPSKLARYVVKIWSDYFSENLIRLYLINPPAILSIMWQVAKQIVDAKTQSCVIFVPRVDDLHEFLAREAIPVDYRGARRDLTGFAESSDSCISKPILVQPEEYFNENAFWKRFKLAESPPLKTITLRHKTVHTIDIECEAGQTLLWLFSTGSEIVFDVVLRLSDNGATKVVWPGITFTTLKIPETGFLHCTTAGIYQARFAITAASWFIAPKVMLKICVV